MHEFSEVKIVKKLNQVWCEESITDYKMLIRMYYRLHMYM